MIDRGVVCGSMGNDSAMDWVVVNGDHLVLNIFVMDRGVVDGLVGKLVNRSDMDIFADDLVVFDSVVDGLVMSVVVDRDMFDGLIDSLVVDRHIMVIGIFVKDNFVMNVFMVHIFVDVLNVNDWLIMGKVLMVYDMLGFIVSHKRVMNRSVVDMLVVRVMVTVGLAATDQLIRVIGLHMLTVLAFMVSVVL